MALYPRQPRPAERNLAQDAVHPLGQVGKDCVAQQRREPAEPPARQTGGHPPQGPPAPRAKRLAQAPVAAAAEHVAAAGAVQDDAPPRGRGLAQAFMDPVRVVGVAHGELRQLEHPHLRVGAAVACGLDEPGVEARMHPRQSAHRIALVSRLARRDASVPPRLGDRREGDERRRAGTPLQNLKGRDRNRRRVESATHQDGRCLRCSQHAAHRAAQQSPTAST